MGWDSFESNERPAEVARRCIGEGVISIVDRGAVVYAAVKTGAEVAAVVALMDHAATGPGGRRVYRVKLMSEREGPLYWDAPPHFLKTLTAPANHYAATWRRRCELKAAGGSPSAEVAAEFRRR